VGVSVDVAVEDAVDVSVDVTVVDVHLLHMTGHKASMSAPKIVLPQVWLPKSWQALSCLLPLQKKPVVTVVVAVLESEVVTEVVAVELAVLVRVDEAVDEPLTEPVNERVDDTVELPVDVAVLAVLVAVLVRVDAADAEALDVAVMLRVVDPVLVSEDVALDVAVVVIHASHRLGQIVDTGINKKLSLQVLEKYDPSSAQSNASGLPLQRSTVAVLDALEEAVVVKVVVSLDVPVEVCDDEAVEVAVDDAVEVTVSDAVDVAVEVCEDVTVATQIPHMFGHIADTFTLTTLFPTTAGIVLLHLAGVSVTQSGGSGRPLQKVGVVDAEVVSVDVALLDCDAETVVVAVDD